MKNFVTACVVCLILAGCVRTGQSENVNVVKEPVASPPPVLNRADLPALSRTDFNRLAAAADLPFYWVVDDDDKGNINPAELIVTGVAGNLSKWVTDKAFTTAFEKTYVGLVERRRQEAVARELNQGRPTPVISDLTGLSADEKQLVRHVLKAAEMTDRLHRKQRGADFFEKNLDSMRPDDRSLFMRNNGPWCEAAATMNDPFCNAVPGMPKQVFFTYPKDMKHELSLCETLRKQLNSAELTDPFTVVRRDKDEKLVALPITDVYGEDMEAVAAELDAAAAVATKVGEDAFAEYLSAAAGSFRSNDWDPANEAWVAMDATNSKFYLRIAADEVYWDLCQQKAGFHTSFAMIDKGSLELQDKLNPLRMKMEKALGKLTPDYQPRAVKFQMPDFIKIIMNAGDARKGIGATIGQSLPNWGSVVERGGSRTVVMTNLYQDPDSRELAMKKAAALLAPETLKYYVEDQMIALIDIILHEATHNLGPYSDFKVGGKRASQIFGGPLATVLEELKAQTGSWFYVPMLQEADVVTEEQAKQLYTHALVWSFGHLSNGLFAPDGNPKPYSQLSAIHVGRLVDAGALEWVDVEMPDGTRQGLFQINYDNVPLAMGGLMRDVVAAKATGDIEAGKAIVDPYITGERKSLIHLEEIKSRLADFPRGSLIYQISL